MLKEQSHDAGAPKSTASSSKKAQVTPNAAKRSSQLSSPRHRIVVVGGGSAVAFFSWSRRRQSDEHAGQEQPSSSSSAKHVCGEYASHDINARHASAHVSASFSCFTQCSERKRRAVQKRDMGLVSERNQVHAITTAVQITL